MTVNEQRSKAVSFTVSYMYYTEEMLMKKEQIEEVNFLQFMDPFDVLVWVMTLVCLIAVTLCIYLINRFTPIQNKDERGNDGTSDEFSLINSLWFSLACMLQQGADSTPRSISGTVLNLFQNRYYIFTYICRGYCLMALNETREVTHRKMSMVSS